MDPSSFSASSCYDSSVVAAASFPIKDRLSVIDHHSREIKKPGADFLHSVRNKHLAKPWRKPIVPPPRVYRVHSSNFRETVQKLTGMPERLQSVAQPPPPLKTTAVSVLPVVALQPVVEEPEMFVSDTSVMMNTLVGMVSPSNNNYWYPWCSVPLLSPETLASLEQSSVL